MTGVDLDDPVRFGRLDQSDALADVEAIAWQWDEAREAHLDVDLTLAEQVCIVGMGVAGIAGQLLRVLVADSLQVPIVVHSGYGLPAFVGPSTQVVALSHAGNTDETLDAVVRADARGAGVAVVTGGGKLGHLARASGWPAVQIPVRSPARHALGWLLVPLLAPFGLDGHVDAAIAALRRVTAECGRHIPSADNLAKQVGRQLADVELAVAWGSQGVGGVVARRLAAQLNQNAKLPAYASTLPDVDHDALAGHWLTRHEPHSGLVIVRDPASEHERVARRVAPTRDLVDDHFAWTAQVRSYDGPPLARAAELVAVCDLISVYAALARGVDPTPTTAMDELDALLA